MMPLQLLLIFIFTLLLLPPFLSTGLVAKPGCHNACGNLMIPYPFGVGSDCSFDPSFDITCNNSTGSPKAYLSILNKEVIEIKETYVRVKYPNLVSACYGMSGESYKNSSMSVNLTGTPYTLSDTNRLTAIGCDDLMMQSNGIWVSGGCSAFCAEKNDSGGIGYCSKDSSTLGNGCCQAYISGDGSTDLVGAELSDMSGSFQRRKLFPCSYAFIQESETAFSYPLYYLDNSTAFQNDYWASATRAPVVRLDWTIIAAENCSRAKQNASTYACKVPTVPFPSPIAKSGCLDLCGGLSIPYPFGVGLNCYMEPSFEIICDASTNPPVAYLAAFHKAEIIQINAFQVVINYSNPVGLACYNLSDYERGITKTKERSLVIDLSGTQYTLSNENMITAIGCDDMVVGIVGQANRSFIGSSCSSICLEGEFSLRCPYASDNYYEPGSGCCNAAIPRGTSYLETNLSDLSGQRKRSKFSSCSYVFVSYKDNNNGYSGFPLDFLNNSTKMQTEVIKSEKLMLDWRIGQGNCDEARQNSTTFACQDMNSECVNFDTKVGGYLCNCSEGYLGNPYFILGCQDINECDDNARNPCASNSICINTVGSVMCSCLKGYKGDGRKDGNGCNQPQTRITILIIGLLCSAFGLLLVLAVCFKRLRNVLKKRKSKKRKENLFKQFLLQHQNNEETFSRTKLFPAKELEKATDHFNETRILGKGGEGIVYKGMLPDGTIVAIKKLNHVDENQVEQFINEVVILSQINHRNVIKLLGCCLATEVPLLVYEFLPNGTLYNLIQESSAEFPLSWNIRLKIAADVAGALAYLHSSCCIPIYHRDIKTSNILLDEKLVVKVADFGISKLVALDQTHLTTKVKGTFGYFDPEYFQSRQYTGKSDVFSFGVVLAELLTGRKPIFRDISEEMEIGLATHFFTSMEKSSLDIILDPQVSEHFRKEEVIAVARLTQKCLNLMGKYRPTMKEVYAELESLRMSHMPEAIQEEF